MKKVISESFKMSSILSRKSKRRRKISQEESKFKNEIKKISNSNFYASENPAYFKNIEEHNNESSESLTNFQDKYNFQKGIKTKKNKIKKNNDNLRATVSKLKKTFTIIISPPPKKIFNKNIKSLLDHKNEKEEESFDLNSQSLESIPEDKVIAPSAKFTRKNLLKFEVENLSKKKFFDSKHQEKIQKNLESDISEKRINKTPNRLRKYSYGARPSLDSTLLYKQAELKRLSNDYKKMLKNKKLVNIIEKITRKLTGSDLDSFSKITEEENSNLSGTVDKKLSLQSEDKMKLFFRTRKKTNRIHGEISKNNSTLHMLIHKGIQEKFKNFISKKFKFFKLFVLLSVFLFTSILKIVIVKDIKKIEVLVNDSSRLRWFTIPQAFLLKTAYKIKFVEENFLKIEEKNKGKISVFNFERIKEMEKESRLNYDDLGSGGLNFLLRKDIEFVKRQYNKEKIDDGKIYKASIETLILANNLDYNNLVSGYNSEKKIFDLDLMENFKMEETIKNNLKLIEVLEKYQSNTSSEYVKLLETLDLEYIFFWGFNILFSILTSLFVAYISSIIHKKISNMSDLLLKINNRPVKIYKEIYKQMAKSILDLKANETNQKNLTISGISFLKINMKKRFRRTSTHKLQRSTTTRGFSSFYDTEDQDIDSDFIRSQLDKKRKEEKNQQQVKFRSLTHKTKKNNIWLFFLIVLCGLLNTPVFLDYFIFRNEVSKLRSLCQASDYSATLASNYASLTGLYYSKIGVYFDIEDVFLNEIYARFLDSMKERSYLQQKINEYGKIQNLIEGSSICNFLKLPENRRNFCEFATENEENFDVFLSMNQVYNYEKQSIGTVNRENLKEFFSDEKFLRNDFLSDYITMALKEVNLMLKIEIQIEMSDVDKMSFVYYVSFPLFLIFYWYIFDCFFMKVTSNRDIKRLENTFLVMPKFLLTENARLKSFFMIEGMRVIN